MNRNQARIDFIKSVFDLADGTTIKVVKGDKTLIEIDGSVITGIMNVADKWDRFYDFDANDYSERGNYRRYDERKSE